MDSKELSELKSASEAIETLSGVPVALKRLAEFDLPEIVAGLLERCVYKLDIEQAGIFVRRYRDNLASSSHTEGPVTIDGVTSSNGHEAALVLVKRVLTVMHGAVDRVGAIKAVNDLTKRLPAELVTREWDAIRPVLLKTAQYDHSGLESRIVRERTAFLAQQEGNTLQPPPEGDTEPDGANSEQAILQLIRKLIHPATGPGQDSVLPPLAKTDGDILESLYSSGGRPISELAADVDADRKTVSARVTLMKDMGLLGNPPGKKNEHAITQKGVVWLSIFKPTVVKKQV